MTTKIRTYTELSRIEDMDSRFLYLKLRGHPGDATFGFDRWINQAFYRSREWRTARQEVIARDYGCDLGVPGNEIHQGLYIHHMNPMTLADIVQGDDSILDPEYLITVRLQTHNAIHYGDAKQMPRSYQERHPGDTKLW